MRVKLFFNRDLQHFVAVDINNKVKEGMLLRSKFDWVCTSYEEAVYRFIELRPRSARYRDAAHAEFEFDKWFFANYEFPNPFDESGSCPPQKVSTIVRPDKIEKGLTYCYLVFDKASGLTKIGKSRDVKQRYNVIKSTNPSAILLHYSPNVSEERLHKVFKAKRKFREWFDLTSLDIEKIKNMEIER